MIMSRSGREPGKPPLLLTQPPKAVTPAALSLSRVSSGQTTQPWIQTAAGAAPAMTAAPAGGVTAGGRRMGNETAAPPAIAPVAGCCAPAWQAGAL